MTVLMVLNLKALQFQNCVNVAGIKAIFIIMNANFLVYIVVSLNFLNSRSENVKFEELVVDNVNNLGKKQSQIEFLDLEDSLKQRSWSRENCKTKYDQRTFLSKQQQSLHRSTMLYTLPGVGNHWIQLLTEYSTGTTF